MSFVKKIWKDRLSAFPKRWKIKFDGSAEAQSAELELDDGTVITQGDRFNAATMNDLEDRIEAAFNSSVAGVTSFNDRSGAVQSQSGDYTSAQITHIYSNEETTDVQTAINNLTTGSLETYEGNPSQWDTTPTAASTKPVTSDGIKTSFNNVDKRLRTGGTTGTDFYFDYQGGKYGWNSSSARGANTFHPFKQPVTDTKTITSKTTTDLGEDHTYRYIDTTGVVNTNSGTYTASSRGAALDMGASNSYRYVNTNSVPNTNSGTYTFASGDMGGTKDMGATNSYRYANAEHVYYKGVSDGRGTLFFDYYNFSLTVTTSGSSHSTATVDVNVGQSGRTTKGAFIGNVYCRAMARYIADLYLVTCSLSGNTATVSITVRGEQGPSTGDHVFNGQIAVVYI